MSEGEQAGELRLDPESIEALARRLAELLAPPEPVRPGAQLITAEEVARRWAVSRRWVYDHADDLGARRLGAGRRPRLRFDPDEVAERLDDIGAGSGGAGDGRRSGPMRSDCLPSSLSARSRAIVGRRPRKRPGRRSNAPRPGAGLAAHMSIRFRQVPWLTSSCGSARLPAHDHGVPGAIPRRGCLP